MAPASLEVTVDGVKRNAMVVAPASATQLAPLVFAFHGHGGNARSAMNQFKIEAAWPEAIVVYPQGLPTATPNDPKGQRNGWDMKRTADNKDLKFFDALLKEVQAKHKVDPKRIFAMGHSNGGGFTYTLWGTRGATFAAMGPSAAAGARQLTPKPAFIVMGEADTTVDPDRQRASIATVRKLNGAEGEGKAVGSNVTLFKGTHEVGTFVHSGGHKFPAECIRPMTDFFRRMKLQ